MVQSPLEDPLEFRGPHPGAPELARPLPDRLLGVKGPVVYKKIGRGDPRICSGRAAIVRANWSCRQRRRHAGGVVSPGGDSETGG